MFLIGVMDVLKRTKYGEGCIVVQLGMAGVTWVRLRQHRHEHRDGPAPKTD
jgi:hypothetical protein